MKCRVLLAVACFIASGMNGLAKEPALVIDSGGNTRYVRKVIFTRDGQQLVSVGDERVIRAWDIKTGKTVRTIRDQVGSCDDCMITDIALSPDNKFLAVGGRFPGTTPEERFAIYIYNFETGNRVQQLKGHGARISALAFSADGKQLASGSDYFKSNDRAGADAPVRLWSLGSQGWQFVSSLQGPNEAVSSLAFSANGERLASGSTDGSLFVWSLNAGPPYGRQQLLDHNDAVYGVAFLPDGRLVSAGLDRRINLWDSQGRLIKRVSEQPRGIRSMDLSGDNESARLLVGLEDGNARLVSLSDGNVIGTFKRDRDQVRAVAFSGTDKNLIASTGGFNGEISLWNVARNTAPQMTLMGTGRSVWRVAFAKDGQSIAFGTERTSDVPNDYGPLQEVIGLQSTSAVRGGYQISVGGKLEDKNYESPLTKVGEYELRTRYGEVLKRKVGPNLFIDETPRLNELMIYRNNQKVDSIERNSQTGRTHLCFTFTQDRRYIISGGENGYLALYDTKSPGKVLHEFRGHTNDVWSVAVSNDGRFVVSGSSDQTIKLWDIRSETYLLSIFVGADNEWIAWTPQGYYTSSLNGDKYVGWQVESDRNARPEFYKAAQFQKLFYRPDVISKFLATRDIQSAVEQAGPSEFTRVIGNDMGVAGGFTVAENPPPEIEVLAPLDNLTVSDRMLKVKVLVTSAKLPITNVQVSLNGFEKGTFKGIPGDQERSRKVEIEMVVALKPKANTLIITAANDIAKSKPQTRTIFYEPANGKPDLPTLRPYLSKIKYNVADRSGLAAGRVGRGTPPPAPTIRIIEPEESPTPIEVSEESLILRVLVPASTEGRDIKVKILVNGQEQNKQDIQPGLPLPINIALADDGDYTISAISIVDGVESGPETRRIRYVNPRPDRPNLYFLGIGIKGYTKLTPSLEYADKDATDLETFLSSLKHSALFNDVQTKVISNADARSDRIFQEIKSLNDKAIHENDVRIVLFSGHGGLRGNVLRDYYFYVQDYDPDKDPEPGSPNWDAILRRLLDPGVRSGRGPVLLFVDTCRAGAATPKRFLDFESLNGLVFFAASASNQKATEIPQWQHGAFTEALLEGLSGCADTSMPGRPSDGKIDFEELGIYIKRRVKELNGPQTAEWTATSGLDTFNISLSPSTETRTKLKCSGTPNQ